MQKIKINNTTIQIADIRESLTADERAELAKALTQEDEEDSGYNVGLGSTFLTGNNDTANALLGYNFRDANSRYETGRLRAEFDKQHLDLFLRVERAWHKHRVKGWEWKYGMDFCDPFMHVWNTTYPCIHKFPFTDEGKAAQTAFLAEIGRDDYIRYCELKTNRP